MCKCCKIVTKCNKTKLPYLFDSIKEPNENSRTKEYEDETKKSMHGFNSIFDPTEEKIYWNMT